MNLSRNNGNVVTRNRSNANPLSLFIFPSFVRINNRNFSLDSHAKNSISSEQKEQKSKSVSNEVTERNVLNLVCRLTGNREKKKKNHRVSPRDPVVVRISSFKLDTNFPLSFSLDLSTLANSQRIEFQRRAGDNSVNALFLFFLFFLIHLP